MTSLANKNRKPGDDPTSQLSSNHQHGGDSRSKHRQISLANKIPSLESFFESLKTNSRKSSGRETRSRNPSEQDQNGDSIKYCNRGENRTKMCNPSGDSTNKNHINTKSSNLSFHEAKSGTPSGHEDKSHNPRSHKDNSHNPCSHGEKSRDPSSCEDKSCNPSDHEEKTHNPSIQKAKSCNPSSHEDNSRNPGNQEDKSRNPNGIEKSFLSHLKSEIRGVMKKESYKCFNVSSTSGNLSPRKVFIPAVDVYCRPNSGKQKHTTRRRTKSESSSHVTPKTEEEATKKTRSVSIHELSVDTLDERSNEVDISGNMSISTALNHSRARMAQSTPKRSTLARRRTKSEGETSSEMDSEAEEDLIKLIRSLSIDELTLSRRMSMFESTLQSVEESVEPIAYED